GHCEAAEVISSTAVILNRHQIAPAGGAATAVELDRVQAQHIKAEADGAFGEAGAGVEDEALRPRLGPVLVRTRVLEVVAVEVIITHAQVDLGIFDESCGLDANREAGGHDRHGERAGNEVERCFHSYRFLFQSESLPAALAAGFCSGEGGGS